MIPKIVTQETLDRLRDPDDRVTMRVVLRRVQSTSAYTVRGKSRRYVFRRDPRVGAHILDVPSRIWMQDSPAGQYRDNPSIAHDLQGNRTALKSPLVFLLLQEPQEATQDAGAAASGEEPRRAFRELLDAAEAPEFIVKAFSLLSTPDISGESVAETIREIVSSMDRDEPEKESPEADAEIRRDGDEFFQGSVKVGGINSLGNLQMSPGFGSLRPRVEELIGETAK